MLRLLSQEELDGKELKELGLIYLRLQRSKVD